MAEIKILPLKLELKLRNFVNSSNSINVEYILLSWNLLRFVNKVKQKEYSTLISGNILIPNGDRNRFIYQCYVGIFKVWLRCT